MITFLSHLAEVMVLFRLFEVEGFPLFFTRSCQQVVKHVVVSGETNVQVSQKLSPLTKTQCFEFAAFFKLKEDKQNKMT